jgi:hypothetical protein
MINRSWRALILGTNQLRPTEDTAVASCRPKCGTKIIIRYAPDLQGETFTGLAQHQRKFSNVANEHHFLCLLGGDLQRDRWRRSQPRLTARPPLRKICVKGLVWSMFSLFLR